MPLVRPLVAVKTLREGADENLLRQMLLEARVLMAMRHPHIIQLVGVCEARVPLKLVLEFCEEGNLTNFLRQGGAARLQSGNIYGSSFVALQVACAVQYLHSKLLLHRDLAARNVLLRRYHSQMPLVEGSEEIAAVRGCGYVAKLADLGLTRALQQDSDYYKVSGGMCLGVSRGEIDQSLPP